MSVQDVSVTRDQEVVLQFASSLVLPAANLPLALAGPNSTLRTRNGGWLTVGRSFIPGFGISRQLLSRSYQLTYTGPQNPPLTVFTKTYELRVTFDRAQMARFANCSECSWYDAVYVLETFVPNPPSGSSIGPVLSGAWRAFGPLPCPGCPDFDGEIDDPPPPLPLPPGTSLPDPGDDLPLFPGEPGAVCLPPPLIFPADPGVPTPCN